MAKDTNRKRIVGVRLTSDEFTRIEQDWKASTCRKLSDYLRKVIFRKPVVANYRNKSMDDLMAELIRLRLELNSIGNNFNQLVKRLHMADRNTTMLALLQAYEKDKDQLLKQVAAIKLFIEKQSELW